MSASRPLTIKGDDVFVLPGKLFPAVNKVANAKIKFKVFIMKIKCRLNQFFAAFNL